MLPSPTHFGPFEVVSRLGRGGMGTVYRGVHAKTRLPVAIKMLAEPLADDENFRQRFNKEIEALRQLRHPNIVRLLGYGQEEDSYYYVMELIEGLSLEEELRHGRRFTWHEALSIGIQIASALNCAHNHGIIHRDLKPANLMLAQSGIVKLSDFGIATLFGSSKITSTGNVVGTLCYMAPEQALGQPTTTRSDLFSFGAVLTALMTGQPPFKASTLPEVLHQHATARARRPSQFGIEIPVEFDELIGRLLEREANKRPKNAYFVLRLLEAIRDETASETRDHTDVGGNSSMLVPLSTDVLQKKLAREHSENDSGPVSDSEPEARDAISSRGVELSSSEEHPVRIPVEPATDYSPSDSELEPGAEPASKSERKREPELELESEKGGTSGTRASLGPESNATIEDSEETPSSGSQAGDSPSLRTAGSGVHSFFLEEKNEEPPKSPSNGESPWAALLMVLVLSTVTILFVARIIRTWETPPPADVLYERIIKVSDDENSLSRSSFIRDVKIFLTCYSQDPRASKVQEMQTEIDLARLEKQLLRSSRGSHFRSVSPIERDYLNAVRTLQSQPEETLKKLDAFILFYEASCETMKKNPDFSRDELVKNMRYLEVARRQIFRIHQVLATEQKERRAILTEEVAHTLELLRSSNPEEVEAGKRLREATLSLYQDREPELVAPLLTEEFSREESDEKRP